MTVTSPHSVLGGAATAMREFVYRSAHPAVGHFPGNHRSRLGDTGQEFRSHVALGQGGDARRLDLLASLRDPLGQWLLQLASERKAIPVYAVADLSASMAFEGTQRRLDVLADFTESLAWSAWRTGDPFGFVGCDARVRTDWFQPPSRSRGTGALLARRLRALTSDGLRARADAASAAGLADAHRLLRRGRALVFLVSDFHLPIELIGRTLDRLAHHEVIPVRLVDRREQHPPALDQAGVGDAVDAPAKSTIWMRSIDRLGRIAHLVDAESGQRRLLWLRPALRERWRARLAAREQSLAELFRARRLRPLTLVDRFDADAVSAHFSR